MFEGEERSALGLGQSYSVPAPILLLHPSQDYHLHDNNEASFVYVTLLELGGSLPLALFVDLSKYGCVDPFLITSDPVVAEHSITNNINSHPAQIMNLETYLSG